MRYYIKALAVVSLYFLLATSAAMAQNWALVWQEEFNYTGLPDSTKWSYDTGGDGFGNNEKQYYTSKRSKNARVESGNLVIETHKETFEGNNYTSARIVTANKADWKYGRLEVRAKLPAGRGLWPAIWMLPTQWVYGNWPESGEIDVMENVGYNPDSVYFTVHTQAYNHTIGTSKGKAAKLVSPSANFYSYILEWYPDSAVFKVDDKKYFTFKREGNDYTKWPFNEHFHLILNTAVGGDWGGIKGIDDAIFPQKFLVDYVRFYKWQPDKGPFVINSTTVNGGIKKDPALASYADNSQVTVTAIPDANFKFLYWKGDVIGTSNPLKLNVRTNIFLNPVFGDAREKVINGGFEKGQENWGLNKGNAANSATFSANEACITIADPGANPWDISMSQTGILLEKGKQYRLKFTASASKARSIKAGVGMSVNPYSTYFYPTVQLTTVKTEIELPFTMTANTDANARVIFDLGGQTGNVCIDNVSLQEVVIAGAESYNQPAEKCIFVNLGSDVLQARCSNDEIKEVRAFTSEGKLLGTFNGNRSKEVEIILKRKGLTLFQIELESGETFVKKIY